MKMISIFVRAKLKKNIHQQAQWVLGTVKAGQICFSHILQKQFTPPSPGVVTVLYYTEDTPHSA